MSNFSFPDPVLIYRPSPFLHRRNYSGEIDVFEAAGYFYGYTEATGGGFNGGSFMQKVVEEDSKIWTGRRSISFDLTIENMVSKQCFNGGEMEVKEIKFKQPSSPGGKLASFLNFLFKQTNSKNKKKTKTQVQSLKDEEQSPGAGRRRQRSSLSNCRSSNHADLKSMNTSSYFRLPLLFVQTAINIEEFKQKTTPLKHAAKPVFSGEKKKKKDSDLVDEKFKFRNGFADKQKKIFGNGVLEKDKKMNRRGKHEVEEKKRFHGGSVDADGGESDSSSDLFELQISNLNNISSNHLPV